MTGGSWQETPEEQFFDERTSASPAADSGPRPRSIYLHAGQLVATSEPAIITSVLGSCVAVCLWSPRSRAGGMNHYLLPYPAARAAASPRFGSVAIPQLIDRLTAFGCAQRELQAKLFGGACVIEAFRSPGADLGTRNVELARKLLAEAGIPIVAEDVGGQRGRKLIFHTEDSTAYVRCL